MSPKRWWPRLLLSAGLAAAAVLAIIFWQERGLRGIEKRLQAGDVAGALTLVDEFLTAHPGHGRATTLRARVLLAAGRAEEAVPLFEQAGAAEPDDLRAWSAALLYLDQPEQALPILERLLQFEPDNPETLEIITLCRADLRRYTAALESGERLARLPGHAAAGHLHLAGIYRDWGYPSLACEHFAQVLEHRADATGLSKPPAEILLEYGESLLAAGNARRALEQLELSGQLKPSPEVKLRQAEAYQTLGEHAHAQALLKPLVGQDAHQREVRERLAESSLQVQDASAAVAWLEPSIERRDVSPHGAFLLQRAYTALGQEDLAQQWQEKTAKLRARERRLTAMRRAAQADPRSPRARLLAAYEAAVNGDWKGAGQILASMLRQFPDTYREDFVQQLVEAVRQSGELPPLEALPQALYGPVQ